MSIKSNIVWKHYFKDRDERPIRVMDLSFNPDGNQLVLAVDNTIEIFDAIEGKIINKLNAHKGIVNSLSYSRDGSFFASGGADKNVIIWTNQLEGHLKYSHSDGIQCVAYNPVSHQILSCAISDIGLWSPEHRNVAKRKVSCQVCSCSWTSDGQYFALGLFNGTVSIWTKNGDEKVKIDRPSASPIWCLSWNPSRDDHYNILSICDWGRKLSFYQLNGRQIGKDHSLDFDPCFLSHSADGDFYMIGGSNGIICLYSKEGIKLGTIGDTFNSWIWSCRSRPGGKYIVACGNDGTVVCYHINFVTVHGLYKDRYAYRSGLTNVIVQHLLTDDKVKLKCRDLVKKVAVYRNRLAVQLSEKVVIYESSTDEKSGDMTYIVKERISRDLQCTLLVCCSENIVFCLNKKMLSLSMKGEVVREWEVVSQIRYLKVLGGCSGKEAMMAGLKNGQILKFFLHNPFPVHLLRISCAVRCVDINMNHTKLAVVDENNVLMVYNVESQEVLYQEPNVTSIAWNSNFEDMLCYSGNGVLFIKADNFLSQQQKIQGLVVGFIGSKVFSLHCINMTTTDISQSTPMMQYIKKKMYHSGYKVACLGVTTADWLVLAVASLEGLNLWVAKKSFARLQEIKYLELIYDIEERISNGETNMSLFLGDIYASQKKFQEAATLYCKADCKNKAMEMFVDLCEFNLAKQFMFNQEQIHEFNELITKEADWAKATNDPEKACDKYISAGEYKKAILLMVEYEWIQKLINFAHTLPPDDQETLGLCAHHLKKLGESHFAATIYNKLHDYTSLVSLYADTHQWDKGFDLLLSRPELKDLLYLPYATYLMETDSFELAQAALSEAGRKNEALNLLNQLSSVAVSMKKFFDAGYYNWLLARANLAKAKDSVESKDISNFVEQFHWHIKASEIYYAYQHIHSFVNLPFTSQPSEAMFNMASFVVHHLIQHSPQGVSKVSSYLTLAKHGVNIEAYKTARYAYEKLQSFLIPSELHDFISMSILKLKTKPLHDREDLLKFCYRCSTSNPAISAFGNFCLTCYQPFTYSFLSFEVLPVVEFFLEDGISDEEAVKLIKQDPPILKSSQAVDAGADVDILQFNESKDDSFLQKLLENNHTGSFSPVTVGRTILANIHWRSIIIKRWPVPLKFQYYYSLLPNVHIRVCSTCYQMFYSEDYELQVLCTGRCPFCRQPPKL